MSSFDGSSGSRTTAAEGVSLSMIPLHAGATSIKNFAELAGVRVEGSWVTQGDTPRRRRDLMKPTPPGVSVRADARNTNGRREWRSPYGRARGGRSAPSRSRPPGPEPRARRRRGSPRARLEEGRSGRLPHRASTNVGGAQDSSDVPTSTWSSGA
jgi:hypothetical protein